jgi:cyclic dehypoxanthinyl futalosine synthase
VKRIRIGTVGYLNAWPLTAQLDAWKYQVVHDHPAGIARALHEGEVDVALAPVAEVLRDDAYRIVPGVAIGAEGPVHSVLLVGDTPVSTWEKVLLDGESRTSAVLAQLLLAGPLQGDGPPPIIERVAPGTALAQAGGSTGVLVIGDAARSIPDALQVRIDLAEEWTAWTGLPFVFAVWAARPGLDPSVVQDLREAADAGRELVPNRFSGDDLAYLTESIRYPLDERALMGLRRFAALGHQAGLLGTGSPRLFGPGETQKTRSPVVGALLTRAASGVRLEVAEGVRILEDASTADLAIAGGLRSKWVAAEREQGDRVSYGIAVDVDVDLDDAEFERALDEGVERGATMVRLWGNTQWSACCTRIEQAVQRTGLPVQALSPGEVLGICRAEKLGVQQVIKGLVAAGLSALGFGSGSPTLDAAIAREQQVVLTTALWAGLSTTGVLVVDKEASAEAIVEHLERLRAVQDATGGVAGVAVHVLLPEHVYVEPGRRTAADYLRLVSLARLFLDNVRHVEAATITQGPRMAQVALDVGADDIGVVGTRVLAGAGARWTLDEAEVERQIRAAARVPVVRDHRYQVVDEARTTPRRMRDIQPRPRP